MTSLTFQILLALADADRHGYGIIKEIEDRFGSEAAPSTGSLYLALHRLEGEGLIIDAHGPADDSGGPPRRYYRLTAAGRVAATAETKRLVRLVALARLKRLAPGGLEP